MTTRALALAATLFTACGKDAPPTPAAGAAEPAGAVVALTGAASAARPSAATRALAIGAPVWGDDTVTTAAGASLTIELAHNRARWDLEGGQSRRVDASLAWKAPARQDGDAPPGAPVGTTAAGRHAEREAAEGASTAVPAVASTPMAEPPPVPPDTQPTPDSEAEKSVPGRRSGRAERRAVRSDERKADSNQKRRQGPSDLAFDDFSKGGKSGGSGVEGGAAGDGDTDALGTSKPKLPSPTASVQLATRASGGLALAAVEKVVDGGRGALGRCLGAAGAPAAIDLVVHVRKDGVPTAVSAKPKDGATDAQATCVTGVAKAWRFPAADADTHVTIEVRR